MNEIMKKALALLSVAILLVGSSGCGCCRGLFGKSSAPSLYSQAAPSCAPVCSGGSCPCDTATPVTYGYGGGAVYGQ